MKFCYDVDFDHAEQLLLILIIGNLYSLKNKKITLAESQRYIFSPYFAINADKLNISKKTRKIILEGAELEDIVSLVPENYEKTLESLIEDALSCLSNEQKPETITRNINVKFD